MSSKLISFAKGPKGPGFQRERSVSPPLPAEPDFTYPFYPPTPYREIREWLPGRPYYNMRLEDFPEYKALGEPLRLHGPAPYRPYLCGCDRYYVCKGMCVCSMSCMTKPLYAWAKANPEAFKEKQREMARWYQRSEMWNKQCLEIDMKWDNISWSARLHFQQLQDGESPMGCASCERSGLQYCNCECEGCGSKYCPGYCCNDDEGEGW